MEENVYRTELTPVSFLQRSALVFPDKTAVVHGDRQYTYREFAERVNRLASRLRGGASRNMIGWHSGAPIRPPCWRLTLLSPPLVASWWP